MRLQPYLKYNQRRWEAGGWKRAEGDQIGSSWHGQWCGGTIGVRGGVEPRLQEHGNPRCYSTFLDEHFNGMVAKIARSCHRSRWEYQVFAKFHRVFVEGYSINSNINIFLTFGIHGKLA